MDRWIHTGACQGPEGRRYDSYGTVQYLGPAIAPAPTRQDKTRQACWAPAGGCWLGWFRHLRDVIWGGTWQVAAPPAGSTCISIVLCVGGCRALARCPGPGTEPGPWKAEGEKWETGSKRAAGTVLVVGSRKSRFEPGRVEVLLLLLCRAHVPYLVCPPPKSQGSQVPSPTPVSSTPTPMPTPTHPLR